MSSVIFQRQVTSNLANVSDTRPSSSSVRSHASRSIVSNHRVSSPQRFPRLTEEELPGSNPIATDSPPLPPKSSKLSMSAVFESDKLDSPPEIPRRLSVPTSRVGHYKTLHAVDGSRYSAETAVTITPREFSVAGQSAANNATSDLPPRVGEDVPPALLPRQPIPRARRAKVKPKPPINPDVTDSRRASERTSLPETEVSPVQLDGGSVLDGIPPEAGAVTLPEVCDPDPGGNCPAAKITQSEAEINSATMLPEESDPGGSCPVVESIELEMEIKAATMMREASVPGGPEVESIQSDVVIKLPITLLTKSDPRDGGSALDRIPPDAEFKSAGTWQVCSAAPHGDDEDSSEDLMPRRPVSEMSRDFDARAAASNVASERDSKPSVPSHRLVIPAAFQNPTVQ